MKRLILIIVLISFTSIYSQSKDNIIEILYGSQFGMCEGYCYSETTYVRYQKRILNKSLADSISAPTKIKIEKLKKKEWDVLINSIDLPIFFSLDSIIGCPDCIDEGEGWLKIRTNKESHMVRFSYDDVPKSIENILNIIEE